MVGLVNSNSVASESPSGGRVVVGVDGSRFGVAALRWALREAMPLRCTVEATMGWQPDSELSGPQPVFGVTYRFPEQVRDEYARALASSIVRARNGSAGIEPPSQVLARGWAPEVLVRASRGGTLLVLGEHGRGGLMDSAVGSVTEYCVRHAYCPVVVVPPRLADPADGVIDAAAVSVPAGQG